MPDAVTNQLIPMHLKLVKTMAIAKSERESLDCSMASSIATHEVNNTISYATAGSSTPT